MAKNKVNEVLKFPGNEAFEKDLTELISIPEGDAVSPVVIAVFDLDEFMRVNDTFGIEIGDRVLINLGKYVAAALPKGATIYRTGGDEFAIIFNNEMEKEDVFLKMEEIRRGYKETLPDGSDMTISVGISEAYVDANRLQELVRKAQSALYRAKSNGRNKVALAKEEKMVPKTSHYTADQLKYLNKISKKEGVGEAILLREALDILIKKYDV